MAKGGVQKQKKPPATGDAPESDAVMTSQTERVRAEEKKSSK